MRLQNNTQCPIINSALTISGGWVTWKISEHTLQQNLERGPCSQVVGRTVAIIQCVLQASDFSKH